MGWNNWHVAGKRLQSPLSSVPNASLLAAMSSHTKFFTSTVLDHVLSPLLPSWLSIQVMLCLHLGYIIIYPAYTWSAIVSFSWNFSCIVHCAGFGQLKFSTCTVQATRAFVDDVECIPELFGFIILSYVGVSYSLWSWKTYDLSQLAYFCWQNYFLIIFAPASFNLPIHIGNTIIVSYIFYLGFSIC